MRKEIVQLVWGKVVLDHKIKGSRWKGGEIQQTRRSGVAAMSQLSLSITQVLL